MPKISGVLSVLAASLALACALPASAATKTTTFTVQATMVSDCAIVSVPTLDFGTIGVQNITYSASTILTINCTPATPYALWLNEGSAGTDVSNRVMSSGGNSMKYQLYSDAGHTQVWGMTNGVDAVSSTGTGTNQPFTIYGQIPVQTTQAPGTYSSIVTVTVSY